MDWMVGWIMSRGIRSRSIWWSRQIDIMKSSGWRDIGMDSNSGEDGLSIIEGLSRYWVDMRIEREWRYRMGLWMGCIEISDRDYSSKWEILVNIMID